MQDNLRNSEFTVKKASSKIPAKAGAGVKSPPEQAASRSINLSTIKDKLQGIKSQKNLNIVEKIDSEEADELSIKSDQNEIILVNEKSLTISMSLDDSDVNSK